MGIYTSTGFSGTSIDIYSPAEQELCCEGFDINYHEAAMMAVAESEAVYNKTMKEIGIAELRYFEENGQEVIYEAVDIKAVFNKIKMFFKKLIDKVKAIFHTFIAKLTSKVSSDKDFVRKYEKEFSRKWNDVKGDFEFKGYTFTIKNDMTPSGNLDISADIKNIGSDYATDSLDALNVDTKKAADVKTALTNLKEHKEEIEEKARSYVLNKFKTATSTNNSYSIAESLDAKDFSTALFELYRNGESSKDNIEKNKLDTANILTELKSSKDSKTAAEKMTKAVTKTIDDAIKKLENNEKALLNTFKPIDPNASEDDKTAHNEKTEKNSALISFATEEAGILRSTREYTVQAMGACLQALKDRSSQYKAIMVKVISGSKKMREESYNYSESYGSGSFLDEVVLK